MSPRLNGNISLMLSSPPDTPNLTIDRITESALSVLSYSSIISEIFIDDVLFIA